MERYKIAKPGPQQSSDARSKRNWPELHPVRDLISIPAMSQEDFAELVQSIRSNGLREPISTLDAKILDGEERLDACIEANVEPRFEEVPPGTDPFKFVIDKNLRRKHLTPGQRAMAAARMVTTTHGGNRRSRDQIWNSKFEITLEMAAKWWGVHKHSVWVACQILRNKDVPKQWIDHIDAGRLTPNTVFNLLNSDLVTPSCHADDPPSALKQLLFEEHAEDWSTERQRKERQKRGRKRQRKHSNRDEEKEVLALVDSALSLEDHRPLATFIDRLVPLTTPPAVSQEVVHQAEEVLSRVISHAHEAREMLEEEAQKQWPSWRFEVRPHPTKRNKGVVHCIADDPPSE